ncbi:uncharacterized protein RCC_02088 [Ramularia collo-cygni]|uniref:Uncharacterized protein n=1 Tax=Ramularia collo-cygni TaxID=112498 RepID=A0A2D3UYI2_9PEZI|nr:uncharacterized protein RCC_02088 [Ramularia collo-cygni]CZT16246.1 uncharacterized protein RCC_02088 [Ramularia collo-cygni]
MADSDMITGEHLGNSISRILSTMKKLTVTTGEDLETITGDPTLSTSEATKALKVMTTTPLPDQLAVEELDKRVQSLPQELQDDIKETLIMSGLPDGLIVLDRTYKPPLGLQIDRASRERFAMEYYKSGAYHDAVTMAKPAPIPCLVWGLAEPMKEACDVVIRWLGTLEKSHIELLQTLQIDVTQAPRTTMLCNDGWRHVIFVLAIEAFGARLKFNIAIGNAFLKQSVSALKGVARNDVGIMEEVLVHDESESAL